MLCPFTGGSFERSLTAQLNNSLKVKWCITVHGHSWCLLLIHSMIELGHLTCAHTVSRL